MSLRHAEADLSNVFPPAVIGETHGRLFDPVVARLAEIESGGPGHSDIDADPARAEIKEVSAAELAACVSLANAEVEHVQARAVGDAV